MGRLRHVTNLARGLDFQDEHGPDSGVAAYRASGSGGPYLAAALEAVGVPPGSAAIDIGCAKGDALRTMRRFPFGSLDGIELDPRLADIARRNFRRLHDDRVTIYTGDAVDFDGYERYDLIYLYNPFPAVVMEQLMPLLDNGARVLYNNPTAGAIVERAGWRRVEEWPNGHEWQGRPTVIALFEHS